MMTCRPTWPSTWWCPTQGRRSPGCSANCNLLMMDIGMSVFLFFICLSVCVFVFLSVYLSFCLCICLSVCVFVFLSVHVFLYLHYTGEEVSWLQCQLQLIDDGYRYVPLVVCLFVFLCVYFSFCLCICLSVCPCVLIFALHRGGGVLAATLVTTHWWWI
jgi:hypothetical protein